jgi:aspartate aminotransferase-like enzyme
MIYEDYAIFTPGPVKMPKEVLEIGAKQTPYFRNNKFSKVVLECEEMLLSMLNAPKDSRVVFLTASGTAGMEAVVMNLFGKDDSAIVVNGGGFGQRFVDLCKSYDVKHTELKANDNLANIKNLINPKDENSFIVNAHETSIGLLYDLDAIGSFCKENNLLNIVDAISMFITDKIDMQKQNINCVIISSQKGLALPPGLTMVVLDKKAQRRVVDVKSHYFNFKNYLKDGLRGQTPYTPAVTIILQLQARLKQIQKSGGVEATIKKAKELARYFREQISGLPLKFYTPYMPNAMTALVPIDGKSAKDIVDDFENSYKTILCPNGGELKDKVFRIGHMGDLTKKDIDKLISELKKYYNKDN